ncbi:hypothetical protein [Embleya sp. NPDC020630]|uniref:hypothetical protein n=1 Tax=Embleya sp. NPDC020630 TaxID=3363979 RepID=UPI0037BB1C7F
MRMLDVHLVHAIARVDDGTQRAIARWAAHRAYALAGFADVDWIVPALAALDAGAPLPAPFDDPAEPWRRLFEDPNVPRTLITLPDGTTHNALQQAFAFPALLGAAEPDSLRAALDALSAAAYAHGTDHRAFLDEVRDPGPPSASYHPHRRNHPRRRSRSRPPPKTRPPIPRRPAGLRPPKRHPPLRRPTRKPRHPHPDTAHRPPLPARPPRHCGRPAEASRRRSRPQAPAPPAQPARWTGFGSSSSQRLRGGPQLPSRP